MDEKMTLARKVYETLCSYLDRGEWKYQKEEENLFVRFDIKGEDIPQRMLLQVDANRQLVSLYSLLPFQMKEEKRIEGAVATLTANYRLVDGNFDYDVFNGDISYRMTASFAGSTIGEGLFEYMIACCYSTVEKYTDKLMALNKDFLSLPDFIKECDK